MLEVNAAWLAAIEQKKGMFSKSLKYVTNRLISIVTSHHLPRSAQDPFNTPIDYSPTGKDEIDHSMQAVKRLLTPHTVLLQSLSSLFQASRYRRPRLMRLLLRLVLRSADAYQSMRYALSSSFQPFPDFTLLP